MRMWNMDSAERKLDARGETEGYAVTQSHKKFDEPSLPSTAAAKEIIQLHCKTQGKNGVSQTFVRQMKQ